MFKNMGGNIPGGNFLGGNFPNGNFPGRSFPDTIHVSGCIKGIYRYLVKIISDFREICVSKDFYILVNST